MPPKLKRTLYIGLGGTGFKTLLHTKRAFIETYGKVPPMIKFLAFDSDKNQYKNYSLTSVSGDVRFEPSESCDIMVSHSKDIVTRHRRDLSWLPDSNLSAVADLENGCGMVRTNGRIAFSCNYKKIRSTIQTALNQIRNLTTVHDKQYELISNDVEVNIVFSVAGGTGSGTFIDMAYLVKDIFKAQSIPETSKIVGYMVLPDVYDAQLQFGKDRLMPNGCGSLVDVDYMMHFPFDKRIRVNYLTEESNIEGAPFNSIIAINNRNLRGDVVNHSDFLSEMMSMAMVVTAGELSGGVNSTANNLERDMNSGAYDIANKRAVIGTLGMSEITFRSQELSKLFKVKAARELASALLNPGSDVDNDANNWIDTNQIRENNGRDDVINYLLSNSPRIVIQQITNGVNPDADVQIYRNQNGVCVNKERLQQKIVALETRVKESLDKKIRTLVNTFGPVYAQDFIGQVKGQIKICMEEMRDEKERFKSHSTSREGAIASAIVEYKDANGKFFGRAKAVAQAEADLCQKVLEAVINDREIYRREGAITFYTWLMQELSNLGKKLGEIEERIVDSCKILRENIAKITSSLMSTRGMFEIDLTKPYVGQVNVSSSSISIKQFAMTLKEEGVEVFDFDNIRPEQISEMILKYTSSLHSGAMWESMTVEDALANLPKEEIEEVVSRAISLSSPMCPLDHRGYISPTLNNYYYIGVQEQSSTGLKGSIIDIDNSIPAGEQHELSFATIGTRDRIVIYHQYGVFPTFAISGTNTYRKVHDDYRRNRENAFSFHIDEDMRIAMERDNFSVIPKEKSDNSLELWVKGLIFGLIRRDGNGVFQYKDEDNDEMALFGYWTSLGSKYRDEAFKSFKRESERLQPQYEEYMHNRAKAEGQDAIDSILADAKINYIDKYSLNDLSQADLLNPLYKGVKDALTVELKYVNKEM